VESFEGARNCQTQKTIFLLSICCGNTGYGVSRQAIQNQKVFCQKINIPKGNYFNEKMRKIPLIFNIEN
jgi:hypothetical protein